MGESSLKTGRKVDVILLLGDFVRHGLSSKDGETNNWYRMWPKIAHQMEDLNKLFPDAVILPCLGNND
jgi:hypothetical protein